MKIQSILKLTAKLQGNEAALYNYMLHSFIREVVDFDSYDAHSVLYDDDLVELLANIKQDLGSDIADQLLASAVEFVITNHYPMPGQKNLWNCIDYLLAKHKRSINPYDQAYLQGLNNSYMSIYEVLDVTPGQSIALREMIGENKASIIVKENLGSQELRKKDVIGVRVVNNGKEFVFSNIILHLSRNLSKGIIDKINFMTKLMSQHSALRAETKAMGISDKEFELQNKKLWIKEIAEGWFLDIAKTRD